MQLYKSKGFQNEQEFESIYIKCGKYKETSEGYGCSLEVKKWWENKDEGQTYPNVKTIKFYVVSCSIDN